MAPSTLPGPVTRGIDRPSRDPSPRPAPAAGAGRRRGKSPQGSGAPRGLASPVGTAALAGLLAAMALLAVGTAGSASSAVADARPGFFPGWLAGPLHPLGLTLSIGWLEFAVLAVCACYLVVLRTAASISARRLWVAIVLAHLAALLAPPLFSGDVFGYLGFARLDVLHGLSPYSHVAATAPADAIYPLLGWRNLTTPYGPLFTLLSDALVPLGIAGGVWAFKAIATLTSLATVALLWRAAPQLRRSRRATIAFYGLNPIVLVFAVAGAHNEALLGMLVAAGALFLLRGRERSAGVWLVASIAVKASAALALPFALIGAQRRGRLAAAAALTALVLAGVGVSVFGPHVLGLAATGLDEQHQVSGHSVPAEVSQLLGLGQLASGVRITFVALFAFALLATLRRAWRGAQWLDCYGWAALALVATSAWLVPWYGLWALLPASLSASRRLRVVTLLACAYLLASRIAIHAPLSAG